MNTAPPRVEDLVAYEGDAYALMITMRADNREVRVEHQIGDDAQAQTDMARLAAEIIDHLGLGPVARELRGLSSDTDRPVDEEGLADIAIPAPPPGVAMLACRCGASMNRADMRWAPRLLRRGRGSAAAVPGVCCPRCAGETNGPGR
jgi:hypothetical protein